MSRCTGETSRGARCRRPAGTGGDRCCYHRGDVPDAPAERPGADDLRGVLVWTLDRMLDGLEAATRGDPGVWSPRTVDTYRLGVTAAVKALREDAPAVAGDDLVGRMGAALRLVSFDDAAA